MSAMDLKRVYKKDPGTIVKEIDDELIILPLGEQVEIVDLGFFYALTNKTATYIWNLIDGKINIEGIIEAVTGRFDIDSKKAESDTIDFLRELHKIKAIT